MSRESMTGDGHEARLAPLRRGGSAAAWVKLGAIAVSIAAAFVAARALPVNDGLQFALQWVERLGPAAPAAFVGIYFAATMLMLPAWPLSVGAGMIFGLLGGTAVVVIGATAGAAGAFLATRYLARGAVERRIRRYPRFAAVDRAVGEGGWKIVLLLRLSPAFPFTLQNFGYGLTAIRFRPCMLATALGILPGTFMYVYLGHAGRAGLGAAAGGMGGGWARYALLGAGLAATVAVTVYVTRLAREAIRKHGGIASELAGDGSGPGKGAAPSASWRGALVAAGAAVAAVFLAACAHLQPNFIMRHFLPPAVLMEEAYGAADGARFDHADFDAILKRYVNDAGGVDYAGLAEAPGALLAYNESLAEAPFEEMGRDERLALLINAYNSFTLQLMIERLGEDGIKGIRDIPRAESWDDARWNVGGNVWSLNQIEHEQIRPKFVEPDIHWVLVCAAAGCPPLRREAYTADKLDAQLRDQARIVHTNGSRWFDYDREANALGLTQLYNWYADDFVQVAGSVTAYAARYAPALAEALQAGEEPRVRFLPYDWSLNDQEALP